MAALICLETIAIESLAHNNGEISDEYQAGKEDYRAPYRRTDATSPSVAWYCYQSAQQTFLPVLREWHDRPAECRSDFVP